jgi:hypothetical protein
VVRAPPLIGNEVKSSLFLRGAETARKFPLPGCDYSDALAHCSQLFLAVKGLTGYNLLILTVARQGGLGHG